MGVNLAGWDASQVEPEKDFDVMPDDWYPMVLVEADMKPNGPNAKDPNGQKLELIYQVDQGHEYAGRKAWDQLNLVNASAQAVEIAQKRFSSICHAIGKLQPNDTDEMLGITIMVHLGIEEGQSGRRNVIKGYRSVADHQAKSAANTASSPAKSKPAAANKPSPAFGSTAQAKPVQQQKASPAFGNTAPVQQAAAGGGSPAPNWAK